MSSISELYLKKSLTTPRRRDKTSQGVTSIIRDLIIVSNLTNVTKKLISVIIRAYSYNVYITY